ncbi:MAG: hypothetical protein A2X49_03260 [Lentisphaerae bacterium GWF2_52_8]|nr:MAG: hypothetical protein A2X49_03260 [Lentisphaerae bacterium GWF2_52_8]
MKAVSAAQMRTLDKRTIEEAGISGELLMARAGIGAGKIIASFLRSLPGIHAQRIILLAGKGNNGGDAYVAARFLRENFSPIPVIVYSICNPDELPKDAKTHALRLPADVPCIVKNELGKHDFMPGDIIVDALLGTGSTGAPRQPCDQWIKIVNASGLPVIALDIPSGLDASDGTCAETAMRADMTIAMGLPKRGFFLNRGPGLCGLLRCVDIGIPDAFVAETKSDINVTMHEDIRPLLPRLPADSHKNSCGRVLVAGGSSAYPGAPALSANAALRSGAGLVFLAFPSAANVKNDTNAIIPRALPDAGCGVFCAESLASLEDLAASVDAVVFGPGISQENGILPVLGWACRLEKALVLDADALNLLAANPKILPSRNAPLILTPHPGEMRRLLDGFGLKTENERSLQALSLAQKTGGIVVLKGHRSIVASPDGNWAVNGSGSPALATAGSGDVLSGTIGAFLAAGMPAFDAARAAVFAHGLAGELSPFGDRGLIADELPELIPLALRELSPFA